MKLCKHAFGALYKVMSNDGWKSLEDNARDNTRPVHALKGVLPKVHVKYETEVVPHLKLFFENDILKNCGPRPTVMVKTLVDIGTSEDLAEKVVVTKERDGREILELHPGFSKNRLYSSYGWENGWKVQYNKATKNYKLLERDDDGWLDHDKHGTTNKKNLMTTDIT